MENAPLNQAHQQKRRADYLLRRRKFDDSIACHERAIQLLTLVGKNTANEKVLESLRLQCNVHFKQIEFIRMKQIHFKNYQLNRETLQEESLNSNLNSLLSENELKTAIFSTIQVQDSLIERLEKNCSSSDCDTDTEDRSASFQKIDGVCIIPNGEEKVPLGSKHPKDCNTTVEELKTLNVHLQALVQRLISQLDERNDEIEKLSSRIKKLEKDQSKDSSKSSLKVITDSSGGTSPYVFSPSSELSPDCIGLEHLPALPPLDDLPNIEYLMLTTSTVPANNSNNNTTI